VRKYNIAASGTVALGRASESVALEANTVQASMIVLGPHSRRLSDREYLGSTALGVARMAECPALVVRSRPAAGYSHGLVGVDFSPPSQRAVLAVAHVFPSVAVTLLHAVQSIDGPMLLTGALREASEAAKGKLRVQAFEHLAKAFPAGPPGRLDSAKRRVVVAPASRALLRELGSNKYGLLALGRDARAALAERVLGSVPANMLMNAPTDVLIVPCRCQMKGSTAKRGSRCDRAIEAGSRRARRLEVPLACRTTAGRFDHRRVEQLRQRGLPAVQFDAETPVQAQRRRGECRRRDRGWRRSRS